MAIAVKRNETVKQEMSQQELQREEFRKRIEQAKADKVRLCRVSISCKYHHEDLLT